MLEEQEEITHENVLERFAEPEGLLALKGDELEQAVRALYEALETREQEVEESEQEVEALKTHVKKLNWDMEEMYDQEALDRKVEEAKEDAKFDFLAPIRGLLLRAANGTMDEFDKRELKGLLESEGVNTLTSHALL